MRSPPSHIAGIGLSESSPATTNLDHLALTAGTRALLDAGITYNDVDQSIAGIFDERTRISRSSFDIFGKGTAPISQVDNHAALFTAVQYIRSGQANCVLVVGVDKAIGSEAKVAVALVLVSQLFLVSHAYLKDSAIRVRACTLTSSRPFDAQPTNKAVGTALRLAGLTTQDVQIIQGLGGSITNSTEQALSDAFGNPPPDAGPQHALNQLSGAPTESKPAEAAGLANVAGLSKFSLQAIITYSPNDLIHTVYTFRGWTPNPTLYPIQNTLQYTYSPTTATSSTIILTRSDGRAAPAWKDVINLRDGRERLGYNPTAASKKLTREDVEAVRARVDGAANTSADIIKSLASSSLDVIKSLPVKGGDRAALSRL